MFLGRAQITIVSFHFQFNENIVFNSSGSIPFLGTEPSNPIEPKVRGREANILYVGSKLTMRGTFPTFSSSFPKLRYKDLVSHESHTGLITMPFNIPIDQLFMGDHVCGQTSKFIGHRHIASCVWQSNKVCTNTMMANKKLLKPMDVGTS